MVRYLHLMPSCAPNTTVSCTDCRCSVTKCWARQWQNRLSTSVSDHSDAVLCSVVLCVQFRSEPKAVSLATELASGALFAFGLVYTGMVRPTKVGACRNLPS
jgi:hypothetical protein